MPAKKRTTKNTTAPAAAPITPAVTPETALTARKAAAAPEAKTASAKPAAKRPAVKSTKAPVTEAAVIEVPVVADAAHAPVRRVVTEDDIRRHAYVISQGRKGPGDPIADWFEAERRLREQQA